MAGFFTRTRLRIGPANQVALLVVAALSLAVAAAALLVQYSAHSPWADRTTASEELPRTPLPAGPRKYGS